MKIKASRIWGALSTLLNLPNLEKEHVKYILYTVHIQDTAKMTSLQHNCVYFTTCGLLFEVNVSKEWSISYLPKPHCNCQSFTFGVNQENWVSERNSWTELSQRIQDPLTKFHKIVVTSQVYDAFGLLTKRLAHAPIPSHLGKMWILNSASSRVMGKCDMFKNKKWEENKTQIMIISVIMVI